MQFPSGVRSTMIAFVIDNKAYIGSCNSNPFGGAPTSEFWEYDPANNTWLQRADIPSAKTDAGAFAIGNKGYVVGGTDASGVFIKRFMALQPSNKYLYEKTNLLGKKPRYALNIICKQMRRCFRDTKASSAIMSLSEDLPMLIVFIKI